MRTTPTIPAEDIARQLSICDEIHAILDRRPGQKKAFEDTVRKVKQASIEQRIEQAVETGDMERFQTLLTEKNRYKNQFPIPD